MSETSTLRYRIDPEYRSNYIKQVKERHRQYSDDPLYTELVKIRKKLYILNESKKQWEKRLNHRRRQIEYWQERKEVLAMEWKHAKSKLKIQQIS